MTSSFNKTKFCNYLNNPSPTGHTESPWGLQCLRMLSVISTRSCSAVILKLLSLSIKSELPKTQNPSVCFLLKSLVNNPR